MRLEGRKILGGCSSAGEERSSGSRTDKMAGGSQAKGRRSMEQAPQGPACCGRLLGGRGVLGLGVQFGFGQKRLVEGKSDGRRSSNECMEAEN